jgi:hypothetical protein
MARRYGKPIGWFGGRWLSGNGRYAGRENDEIADVRRHWTTKSTPGAWRISLIMATPISARPLATSSKIGADMTWPGLGALDSTIFCLMSALMPSCSTSRTW